MNYEHLRDKQEWYKVGGNFCLAHFHRSIEIVFCEKGDKTVFVNGDEILMKEGEILMLPPFAVHEFPKAESTSLCIVMPMEYSDVYETAVGKKKQAEFVISDKKVARTVADILYRLSDERSTLARDGIYKYALGVLIENAELCECDKKNADSFAFVVLNYLENNFGERLTLTKAAGDLGYNRCYFSTVFKNTFHTGFCEYLSSLRVEKALPMLNDTSISDISQRVGFGSVQSFYTAFKREKGMSPVAYKQKKESKGEK